VTRVHNVTLLDSFTVLQSWIVYVDHVSVLHVLR